MENDSVFQWTKMILDHLWLLIPIAVLLLPGLKIVPTLYIWRVRQRIYGRYAELMTIEREAYGGPIIAEGKVFVGGAGVVKTDVSASNGVIHVINQVLIPR